MVFSVVILITVIILFTASHPESFFDVVLSGMIFPSLLVHSLDLLAEIARILKPSGKLTLTEAAGNTTIQIRFRNVTINNNTFHPEADRRYV